jgi:HK97 family phage major capsid protein
MVLCQSGADLRHAARQEARKNLTPDRIKTLLDDGQRIGSLKESFLSHADEYGITDIDLLFPDATLDANGITTIQRRNEWVADVLTKTKHTPFGRIKSLSADITADEARARGYVKGNQKKDEVVKMLRRVTTPKTIYKKQKLDRDDIIDITEIDVVAWLKAEMRVMLDEEIARAILIGDGRDADDEDKIDEDHIRPIAFDIDMYTDKVNLPANFTPTDLVDLVVRAQDNYKGTGTPTLYTTKRRLTDMLLAKDSQGRRLYATKPELAAAMLVDDIVPVEVMEQQPDLVGVLVNLADYTVGADKGGEVSMFDDFDIDFNQQKYLIETRISGALTRPKGAVALFVSASTIVTPQAPTFANSTGIVTVPTVTGVDYYNKNTGVKLTSGPQPAITVGAAVEIQARPQTGYGLTHGADSNFEFTRTA